MKKRMLPFLTASGAQSYARRHTQHSHTAPRARFSFGLWKALVGFFVLIGVSLAQGQTSRAKDVEKMIETKETVVDVQGKKYRQIEIEKERFFIEMLDSTAADQDLRVLCLDGTREFTPPQIQGGVKVTPRAQVVIEGLRKACIESTGARREVTVDSALLVGLSVDIDKKKKRKVIVSPMGLWFRGEF